MLESADLVSEIDTGVDDESYYSHSAEIGKIRASLERAMRADLGEPY
jgi:hypothetical protein